MAREKRYYGVAENSPGTTGEGAFITDPHPATLMKGASMEKFTYPPSGEEPFNVPDCELEGLNSEPETAMIIVEKHFGTDPLECHENAGSTGGCLYRPPSGRPIEVGEHGENKNVR